MTDCLTPTEYQEQCTLIAWARLLQHKYPSLALLHSSLNGAYLPRRKINGKVFCPEAKRQKKSGMLPGVPDLFLPYSDGKHHGMFIEMKRKGGHATKEQRLIHDALRAQGYRVDVCQGADTAKNAIREYMGIGDFSLRSVNAQLKMRTK